MVRILASIVLAMIVLGACSDSSDSNTPQPTSASTMTPSATSSLTPGQPTLSPTVSGTPVATAISGTLKLTILAPVDEIVVDTSSIAVKGQVTAGAEVSINGNVANVDTSGSFTSDVTLEEGANEIEIMATDESENETLITITVFYVK